MPAGSNGEEWYYNVVILGLAAVGVVVNACSLVVLVSKGKCTMFYNCLKLLATSDFVVVVGGALLYGLPDYWGYYSLKIYPFTLPYVLPIVQIAMMISVYTTILMSFERYVRIGHTCRLKDCSYITEDNFKYYMIAIVIGPCLFYVPKFFELRSVQTRLPIDLSVDCETLLNPSNINVTVFKGNRFITMLRISFEFFINYMMEMFGTKPEEFLSAHEAETSEELVKSGMDFSDYVNNKSSGKYVADADTASESSVPFLAECENTNFSHFASVSKMINVTQFVETVEIESTELRRNTLYYRIYCIALNSMVSLAFPLLSLLYLNIYTVLALRAIGKENGAAISSRISNAPRSTPRSNSVKSTHLTKFTTSATTKKTVRHEAFSEGGANQREYDWEFIATSPSQESHYKRWRKTCSTFEMSILKRHNKMKNRSSEKEISMRFVRETHSIEVVMKKTTESKNKTSCWKKPQASNWTVKKRQRSENSPTGFHSAQMRVRSESQCEYSPQKRNTVQMLQRRGRTNPSLGPHLCYGRIDKKSKKELPRRRTNSAPNLLHSFTDDSNDSGSRQHIRPGDCIPRTSLRKVGGSAHAFPPHDCKNGSSEATALRISLLRSGEARLTRIALAIVWLFIFCHAWRLIPTIFEAIYPGNASWPTWLLHVHGISHSLIVFNSAVNFLLYTVL